jgi:hypothetical protein
MIGFEKDIIASCKDSVSNIPSFSNFDFIDTDIIFEESRKKIDFFIPEFVRYISGDRRKSKIYGIIRKYYTEELIYINDNILDSNVDMKNFDTLIEDSCSIYRDLRVVILNEDIDISNITGYDIISFTRNDNTIYTVFIQDTKVDAKLATSICLKLFDKIIVTNLYKFGIPVFRSNYISLDFNGVDGFKVSKFIYDYFYELLYPFTGKIITDKNDVSNIAYQLSRTNFEILSEDQLIELYDHIKTRYDSTDKYDYIELIAKYQAGLEGKNLFNTDN